MLINLSYLVEWTRITPIVITTKEENTGEKGLEKRMKTSHTKKKDRYKFFWSKEAVVVYKERTDNVRWEDVKENKTVKRKKIRYKVWWDRSRTRKKR